MSPESTEKKESVSVPAQRLAPTSCSALTMTISDPSQASRQVQLSVLGTAAALLQLLHVSHHGLVVFLLLIEGLGHVRKPLVQLGHTEPSHQQPAGPSRGGTTWNVHRADQQTPARSSSYCLFQCLVLKHCGLQVYLYTRYIFLQLSRTGSQGMSGLWYLYIQANTKSFTHSNSFLA